MLTYGHNMIDGSMYSAFAGFTDQEFFDGHREILFLTPEHNYRLEAVAAREVSAYDDHPRPTSPPPPSFPRTSSALRVAPRRRAGCLTE